MNFDVFVYLLRNLFRHWFLMTSAPFLDCFGFIFSFIRHKFVAHCGGFSYPFELLPPLWNPFGTLLVRFYICFSIWLDSPRFFGVSYLVSVAALYTRDPSICQWTIAEALCVAKHPTEGCQSPFPLTLALRRVSEWHLHGTFMGQWTNAQIDTIGTIKKNKQNTSTFLKETN